MIRKLALGIMLTLLLIGVLTLTFATAALTACVKLPEGYDINLVPRNYTLTITVTGGGTTSPAPGTYIYPAGTTVSVSAIPYTYYIFHHWELDGANVGSANPYSVLMNSNHALHAVFVRITYTLTITCTEGGTTDPSPGTYKIEAGPNRMVIVFAIPDTNYTLDHWKLDGVNVSAENPISITMDRDHALHAVFVSATPAVSVWISPMISTGQTFKVDIMVSTGVPDAIIYAWRAEVTFDPTVMAARSLEDGSYILSGGPVSWVEKSIDNTNGVIKLNQTLLGDVPGVNGTGVLATVTFKVIKPENSSISLTNVRFCDRLGASLEPLAIVDGYFTPTHDVAVKSVTIDGLTSTPKNRLPGVSEVYPGWPIKVIISNLGNYNETAVNVTLFIVDEILGVNAHIKIETLEAPLPPGTDDELTFHIRDPPELDGLTLYVNYTLIVEAAIDAPETLDSVPDNNVCVFGYVMVKMVGDVNCDKIINILDVAVAARAFGAKYNETDGMYWHEPPCEQCPHTRDSDLNADRIINIIDIAGIARRFGEQA